MRCHSLRAAVLIAALAGVLRTQAVEAPAAEAPAQTRVTRSLPRPYPYVFKWRLPAPEELRARREALAQRIGDGAALVISRAPSRNIAEPRYRPDDNFYYLSGVETDPGALLLVAHGGRTRSETLFLPTASAAWDRWNGPRSVVGEPAAQRSGIQEIVPLKHVTFGTRAAWKPLEKALLALPAAGVTKLYLDHRAHRPAAAATGHLRIEAGAREQGITAFLAARGLLGEGPGPRMSLAALAPLVGAMRAIKSPYEVEMIQEAVDITGEALVTAIAQTRPGMWEFEVAGILQGVFFERGANRPAYAPIVAGGPNTCVLHYVDTRRRIEDGDLVLCDVGAEFGYYAADVTRTFPANGRFTPEQRRVYETVLAAQAAGARILRPGISLGAINRAATRVIKKAGFDPDRVFYHGVGHFVGLNVHDPGSTRRLLPGSVITVEPGIYLRDRGLGVRIEDVYLITADGHRCLSARIPKDPDAIEALMREE